MKDESKQKFFENLLFNEYKDSPIPLYILKKKYFGLEINWSDFNRRRTNYQIKRYGCQLDHYSGKKDGDNVDFQKKKNRAIQREYQFRKKYLKNARKN